MVRLPVGDWTLEPYGPYVGCMDGSEEKIQWFYDTAHKYGIKVWLDVHAIKDSQNGFDNSGQAKDLQWTDETHFKHWSIQTANWLGDWNVETKKYDNTNWDNVKRSVEICEGLIKRWHSHPAFAGFEPVNEPWWNSNTDVLKTYYRQVRDILRKYNPDALFIFHNSFIFEPSVWNDIFPEDDMKNVVMDHHFYHAFADGHLRTVDALCDDYEQNMAKADQFKFPVWIGEWSLGTDVCAHWLGGFNDANTKPQFECKWVDCPKTYMKEHGTDFDRTAAMLGPFGEFDAKTVTIQNGKCSTDSDYFSEDQVKQFAKCALEAQSRHVAGSFIWAGHVEIQDKWSYIEAHKKGWLTQWPNQSKNEAKHLEKVADSMLNNLEVHSEKNVLESDQNTEFIQA